MTDTPDKPTQRFGEHLMEVMAALDEVNQPSRGGDLETFLDAAGRKRRFRLEVYGGGPLTFLSAREERTDGRLGLRLLTRFDEATENPPFGLLRDKIRARLATRDVVRDPDNGRLQLLTGQIRAQLTCDPDDPDGPPAVLVDDELLSWDELGDLLAGYEGFGLRVQVTDE